MHLLSGKMLYQSNTHTDVNQLELRPNTSAFSRPLQGTSGAYEFQITLKWPKVTQTHLEPSEVPWFSKQITLVELIVTYYDSKNAVWQLFLDVTSFYQTPWEGPISRSFIPLFALISFCNLPTTFSVCITMCFLLHRRNCLLYSRIFTFSLA